MRKHFLILMLLTLLPLAGFADNITILPANLQYTWGVDQIPTVQGNATADMVAPVGNLPNSAVGENVQLTRADIAAALTFIPRAGEITGTGTFNYGLVLKEGYNDSHMVENVETNPLAGHTIIVSGGDGQLKVLGKQLTEDMIANIAAVDFKNAQWKPEPVVKDGNTTLTAGAEGDFTFSWGENIHAGNGTVTITANEGTNYSGSATKQFTINPLALASVTVGAIADQTYNHGAPITPTLTVKGKDAQNNEYTLRANNDYTVNYTKVVDQQDVVTNINAGNAEGILTAVNNGDFTFAANANIAKATFKILPKNLSDAAIKLGEIVNNEFNAQIAGKPYASAAVTVANPAVKWTYGEGDNDVLDITNSLTFSYANNTVVGTATIKGVPADNEKNYTGEVVSSFSILPVSIENAVFDFGQDPIYYNGAEQTPAFTVKLSNAQNAPTLTKDVDYVIVADSWKNNKNATPANAEDAQKPAVTIKGIGNYDAVDDKGDPVTRTGNFTIAKKVLTITADDVTTTFGASPESKFSASIDVVKVNDVKEDIGGQITYQLQKNNGNVEEPNWQDCNEELNALAKSTGLYRYMPTWAANPLPQALPQGKTAADYDSEAQENARKNYDYTFTAINTKVAGAITVTEATLTIKPDNITVKYGSAAQQLTYKVYNGNEVFAAAAQEGFWSVEPTLVRSDANNKNKGVYTISVSNVDQVAANDPSYQFVVETGTYEIEAFPITVTANAQKVLYGNEPNTSAAFDAMVRTVNAQNEEVAGDKVTVTFSPAETGNHQLINRADLNLTLSLAKDYDGSVGPHTGALVPAINNDNYIAKIVPGDVEVMVNPGLALALDTEDEELADKVAAAATSKQAHKVTFANFEMNNKEWYAIVLPFETTPAELVAKLGKYVVVNRLKSSTIDETGKVDVNFGLEMDEIPAGEPILIKVTSGEAEKYSWNAAVFTGKNIAAEPLVIPTDKAYFTGTYNKNVEFVLWGKNLDGTVNNDAKYRWLAHKEYKNDNNWKNPKNTAHALTPMEAYLILDPAATKANVFVEDFDFENNTTAIKSISVDEIHGMTAKGMYNLNGMKMQSAPTQKGVYIQNGKKVILK